MLKQSPSCIVKPNAVMEVDSGSECEDECV